MEKNWRGRKCSRLSLHFISIYPFPFSLHFLSISHSLPNSSQLGCKAARLQQVVTAQKYSWKLNFPWKYAQYMKVGESPTLGNVRMSLSVGYWVSILGLVTFDLSFSTSCCWLSLANVPSQWFADYDFPHLEGEGDKERRGADQQQLPSLKHPGQLCQLWNGMRA